MKLEVIEQKCLNYLKQVSNPLVDVNVLYGHVMEGPDTEGLSYVDLLDFLRHHELFKVMEPVGMAVDPDTEQMLGEAGLPVTPQVILCTRIPTQAELAQAIREQLGQMKSALVSAMREAAEKEDPARKEKVQLALHKMQMLEEKLDAFL
jgi:hypothetical protein